MVENHNVKLNFSNFMSDYMLDCYSDELDPKDRPKALTISIIIGLLSAGLVHAVCGLILLCRSFIHIKDPENEVEKKTNSVGTELLTKTLSPTQTSSSVTRTSPFETPSQSVTLSQTPVSQTTPPEQKPPVLPKTASNPPLPQKINLNDLPIQELKPKLKEDNSLCSQLTDQKILELIESDDPDNEPMDEKIYNKFLEKDSVITKLSDTQIKKLHPKFLSQHWKKLSKAQLDNLFKDVDFKLTTDLFNKVYDSLNLETPAIYQSFQALPFAVIKDHLDSFKNAHWTYLSDSHIESIKNDTELLNKHFNQLFPFKEMSYTRKNHFEKLDIATIKEHLTADYLPLLSYKQMQSLEPQDLDKYFDQLVEKNLLRNLSKEQQLSLLDCEGDKKQNRFNRIFAIAPKDDSFNNELLFKNLEIETIAKLHPFFKPQHWKALTKEQVNNIIKHEELSQDKKIFENLFTQFNPSGTAFLSHQSDFEKASADYLKLHLKSFKDVHWQALSENQVQAIVKDKALLDDKDIFANFFKPLKYENQITNKQEFQALSKEDIDRYKTHFSGDHWLNLCSKQVAEIAGDEAILEDNKEHLTKFFSYCVHDIPVVNFDITKIEKYRQYFNNPVYFNSTLWNKLSEAQIKKIIEKKDLLSNHFKEIFNNHGLQNEKFKNQFQKLDLTFIKENLVKFASHHYQALSKEQIDLILNDEELSKNKKVFTNIFAQLSGKTIYNTEMFKKLPLDYLKKNLEHFQPYHYEALSEEQRSLMLEDEDIAQNSAFFDRWFTETSHFVDKLVKNKELFSKLTANQILTNAKHFSRYHCKEIIYLYNAGKLGDIFNDTALLENEQIFNGFFAVQGSSNILNSSNFQNLKMPVLEKVIPYFKDAHWTYLTQEQKEQINQSDNQEIKALLANKLANK